MAYSDSLRARIQELGPWFHNLDLAGIQTAPDHFLGDYPACKWRRFAHSIPSDLTGCNVLDIGCNAGFYAMEMKRRGAARVIGIDTDPDYLRQAALASEVTGLPIELRQMSVYEVASLGMQFDIVLFLGVLYHLRYPLLALDLIARHVVSGLLVCQCLQRGSEDIAPINHDYAFDEETLFHMEGAPRMQFIERSFAGDPTNWWIPNPACVAAMLRSAGFHILQRPEPEVYVCRAAHTAQSSAQQIIPMIGHTDVTKLAAS
jgi:tRNA (mo5U34)-methyltransferase